MKTNYLITKLAIICMLIGLTTSIYGQTNISTLAEFTSQNASITDETQLICAGKNVQLNAGTPPANVTYEWETRFPSADGTGTGVPLGSNTGQITDVPTDPGFYTYKLKATNTVTGCSDIFDQIVFVLPNPAISIGAPSDLAACSNVAETFAFTSTLTNNTVGTFTFPVDYQWYSKKGTDAEVAITDGTTADYTFSDLTADGSYEVYVRATLKIKACAPAESNKSTITITPPPTQPTITISSN